MASLMAWLVGAQTLVGMLLVLALLRPRDIIRPLVSAETARAWRSKIRVTLWN